MQWVIRDVSLGSNIQNIRLRSGLTQDQLIAKMQIREAICHAAHWRI